MLHVTNVTCYIFPDWGCLFLIWLTEMGRPSPAVLPKQHPPSVVKKNHDKFCIVPDNLYLCPQVSANRHNVTLLRQVFEPQWRCWYDFRW